MQAANIEHQNIEAESRQDEDEEQPLSLEELMGDKFSAEEIQERVEREAALQAEKFLKKNKREIDRLKRHAELCIYKGNFEGYAYAIRKLRELYRQPKISTAELTEKYNDTRAAILTIAQAAREKLK